MASQPSKLQGYLVAELRKEFPITDDQTFTKWATAISKAVHTYIVTDVEVKVGIPVQVSPGTGTGATIGPEKTF